MARCACFRRGGRICFVRPCETSRNESCMGPKLLGNPVRQVACFQTPLRSWPLSRRSLFDSLTLQNLCIQPHFVYFLIVRLRNLRILTCADIVTGARSPRDQQHSHFACPFQLLAPIPGRERIPQRASTKAARICAKLLQTIKIPLSHTKDVVPLSPHRLSTSRADPPRWRPARRLLKRHLSMVWLSPMAGETFVNIVTRISTQPRSP